MSQRSDSELARALHAALVAHSEEPSHIDSLTSDDDETLIDGSFNLARVARSFLSNLQCDSTPPKPAA